MLNRIINYVSPDEVNGDHASHLAKQYDVELRIVPRLPSHEPDAAVLYDGDSHPQPQVLLDESCPGPTAFAVAIHGYTIDEGMAAALRAKGVIVSVHLEGAIQGLVKAIAAERDGETSEPDAAIICAEVRAVASEAHRAKKRHEGNGEAASQEWMQLEGRIDHLQRQLERLRLDHQLRLDELLRWLGNLRRLVQVHGKT
jgi:hypothetical protein